MAESGGNPNAVSPRGAIGPFQIMPETGKNPGFGIKPLNFNDLKDHERFATDYMGALLDKFNGNEMLATAAYNAGAGNIEKHGGVPPFQETMGYVSKIGRALNPISDAQAEIMPQGNGVMQQEKPKLMTKEEFIQQYRANKPKKVMSKEEFIANYRANKQKQTAPQEQKLEWGDVPGKAFNNLPESTATLAKGTVNAALNPIDTITGLLNITSGELYKALPEGISKRIQGLAMSPEKAGEVNASAEAFNEFMATRYGGMEQLKQTIANDPAGFLSDLSVVLGGAGGLVTKAGKANIGSKISKIGTEINPLNMPVAGIKKGVGIASREILGRTTGVGSEAMSEAFKAGKVGNATFMDNLKGDVPMDDVLIQAKDGLSNIMHEASNQYQQGMRSVSGQYTPGNIIPFKPVMDKFDSLKNSLSFKSPLGTSHSKIGSGEANIVHKIGETLKEWQGDAFAHTPMGFDALKQRLDAIDVNYKTQRQAARVKTEVRKEVYDQILNKSPQYKDVMKDYETSRKLVDEIERAFSLGNKASKDTALRKIQSLTRNNANTNYGNRIDLARKLNEYGGEDIMPAVAGQAFNSWLSRGLAGNLENLGTFGAALALQNPFTLFAMVPQSPKIVGAATYGAGKASNYIPDYNPEMTNFAAFLDRMNENKKNK